MRYNYQRLLVRDITSHNHISKNQLVSILNVDGSSNPEICSGVCGIDDKVIVRLDPSVKFMVPRPVDNELTDSSNDLSLLTIDA